MMIMEECSSTEGPFPDVLNQIQPHNEPSPENDKGALKGNSIINADPSYHLLKLHH